MMAFHQKEHAANTRERRAEELFQALDVVRLSTYPSPALSEVQEKHWAYGGFLNQGWDFP